MSREADLDTSYSGQLSIAYGQLQGALGRGYAPVPRGGAPLSEIAYLREDIRSLERTIAAAALMGLDYASRFAGKEGV